MGPLPDHVLADPQVIAACASRQIGALFSLARRHAGLGPARIGQLTGLGTSRVSEYLQGQREVTSITVIERVADGLRIPGHMLGLAVRPWERPPAPAPRAVHVPETWEILDLIGRSTASDAALTHLEAAVADAAFRYPSTGPTESVPVMQRQLAAVHDLIGRPQAVDARRRSIRILTVLSGLLGLAAHDMGDAVRSDAMFHMGSVAADEGEADELTAWLLTMQSIAAYTSGRTGHAAMLLGRADQLAALAAPRRRAWIAANRAKALASHRDERGALVALDQAAQFLAEADEPIGGLDFFTEPRLDGIAGETRALLGQHGPAADLIGGALARRDRADVKGLALLTLDLAECRLGAGDLAAACTLAHDALDLADGSVVQPIVVRARAFQRSLGPWRGERPVQVLMERVRESGAQLVRV
ncbi:helix-turn-helix domain-containing protein [Kitasatospora cineracea]|uniref:helix-turn-helix domain-containing protein n=1 Tax=Kitasatospora cineracea TaxID=88074 RepID=UPI0037A56CA6